MDNLERYIITEAKRFIDDEERKLKEYQNISAILSNSNIILNNPKEEDSKDECFNFC